jgi:peptidoglycan/xylan/chitin deacetylase (PgdA/CDA1 family)
VIPGAGRLARAIVRLARTGRPAAVILLYHRVAHLPCDPQWLAVAPDRFRQQLEVLGRLAEVIPLATLPGRLTGRSGRRPLAAITFDDGYDDNLHAALPLLTSAGMPATVFATSGFIGAGREPFWDDLERLILSHPDPLPTRIPGTDIDLSQAEPKAGPTEWNAVSSPSTGRQRAYLELCQRASRLDHHGRIGLLDALRSAIGETTDARPTHRFLDRDGLRTLDASGVIEVGSHTRHHLSLANHPTHLQLEELAASRRDLEALLGHPVTCVAYPFGTAGDHDRSTRSLARRAGYQLGCSNHPGLAWSGSDRMALPRMLVRDWDVTEFEGRLRAALAW